MAPGRRWRLPLLLLGPAATLWAEDVRHVALRLGHVPKGSVLSSVTHDLLGTHSIDNWGAELLRAQHDVHEVQFHDPDGDLFLQLEAADGKCLLNVDANARGLRPVVSVFQMINMRCRVTDLQDQQDDWVVDAEPVAKYSCNWNGTVCAPPQQERTSTVEEVGSTLVSVGYKERLTLLVGSAPEGSKLSVSTGDLFGTQSLTEWAWGAVSTMQSDQHSDISFTAPDGSAFLRLDAEGGSCILFADARPFQAASVKPFQMKGLKCTVAHDNNTWTVSVAPQKDYQCDWTYFVPPQCASHRLSTGQAEHDSTTVSVAAAPAGSKLSPATQDLFKTHSVSSYGSAVTGRTDQQVEVTFDDTDGTAFLRLDAPEGSCVLLVDANPVGSRPQAKVFQMSGLRCKVSEHHGVWSVSAAPAKGYRCDWDSDRCSEGDAKVI